MNHPEKNEQATRESALTEMRQLAALDVNRILRDVETRKQGLVRAIKARSISIARGFAKRVKNGLEEASASAEVIGDNDFPVILRAVAQSVTELEDMIPQGVGKDVSDDDVNGLSALAAGISVPSLYEPKFNNETPTVFESPVEPDSKTPSVEIKAEVTLPPEFPAKTEPTTISPIAQVPTIEQSPENPEPKDAAQPTVGAGSKSAKAPLSDKAGLGETQEDDNLPLEAAKFSDTSRVERVRRSDRKRKDEDNGGAGNKASSASKSKSKPTAGVRRGDPRGHEFTNGIDISTVPKKFASPVESQGVGANPNDVMADSKGASQERPRQQERSNGEKEATAPNLEQIIAEVKDVITRGEGENLVSVPKEDVEIRIRRMSKRFGGINFNKRPPVDKEAEIVREVNAFTSNEVLRADLERVFRKMAKVSKVEAGLPAKPLLPTDSTSGTIVGTTGGNLSQTEFDASRLPRESPFHPASYHQYDSPIGPKIPLQITDAPPAEVVDVVRESRRKALKFNDLGTFTPKDLEAILSEAGPALLAKALISAGDIKFLESMPEAFKAELLKEIKVLSAPSDADSNLAQESVLEIARKLEAAGTVSLSPKTENSFSTKGGRQYSEPVGPKAPPEGVSKYPEPIGPKPPTEGVSQYAAPIGPELPPQSPKKETKRERQDRVVRELRQQVLAEKRAEVEAKKSGGGTGRPPAKPPTDESGGSEGSSNPENLELNGTETAEELPVAPPKLEVVEMPVKMVVSPSEALVKAVLEDPAGFDIGKAMDVPGFDEFLAEGEKMGVVIDMADSASLQKRFEAFAFKDVAAAGTYELYADSISKDIGLSLDDEGKQAVREHLERQAHVDPESIKGFVDKLKNFKELPSQIEEFEGKINELKLTLSPEAQERARQPLEAKREAFQMALRTNQFWPRWSKKEGWGGLGYLHLKGEKAAARSEAAKEARSSGLGLVATLGFGLSTKELKAGLQRVEEQLANLGRQAETAEAGKLKIAELEAIGQQAKKDLENAKVNLFQDSTLTRKLVGMARAKVREQILSGVFWGEETVEKAVSANELFERAIRASSGNHFGDDDGDYLEGVDVPMYRKSIDEALDRGISKDIEKSIVRSMALSEGRFGELQKAFDKLTANERLGSKSRAEVRRFIVKKLKNEIELVARLNTDESTDDGRKQATDAKLKTLHLKALVVKQQEALVLNK